MSAPTLPGITGLILAGGRGTRMGSVDKGLQLLHQAPMVTHVMQRLTPQVDTIIINANRNLDIYRQFGVPVVADQIPDFAGPLAGFHTGMQHCQTEYLVTVPCDAPFLPQDLVPRLHAALQAQQAELAIATSGAAHDRQPVFCLLKARLLPQLNVYLESGGRKVGEWMAAQACATAHFDDDAAFSNINTLEDLRKFGHEN